MHRRQWVAFDGAPITTTVNAHTALHNQKMNVGIAVLNDHYGVTTKFQFKSFFAYRIFAHPKNHLSFGISASVNQISNRWSEINTTVAGDPMFTSGDDKFYSMEFGFGAMYRTPAYAIGFTTPGLINTAQGGQLINLQYLISGEYNFSIGTHFVATPMLAVRHVANSPLQYDLSAALTYQQKFTFGIGYRKNDALMFITKFKINEQLEGGYAYDLTVSKLRTFSNGSHEIMIRYLFHYRTGTRRPRI